MKILHTADWHLGKKLEGYDRYEEQEAFLNEIVEISDKENIDMVIIAGDVYDVPNPPTYAERLFYKYLKILSKEGERPVIVLAGNHDNPQRLTASSPLAYEYGIILFGYPFEKKDIGDYGKFKITKSYEGAIELELKGEKIFLNVLPYPSEKTLNSIIFEKLENDEMQLKYSKKIGEILSENDKKRDENSINIIISHIFINGSESEGTERTIEFGGAFAVDISDIPKADYVALGHIHKCMKFKNNICYSGSPLEYRVSENISQKRVLVAEINKGEDTVIKDVILKNTKPIKKYITFSIEEAIQISIDKKNENEWIYLIINSNRPIKNSEIHLIKENKNIISIEPNIKDENIYEENIFFEFEENTNISEAFKSFYYENNKVFPDKEIVIEFLKFLEEKNETDIS